MKKSNTTKYWSDYAERFSTLVNILLETPDPQNPKENIIKNKTDLARKLDNHAPAINAIMRGERDVTRDMLLKLIEHYPVNPDYIWNGQEPKWFNIEKGTATSPKDSVLVAIKKTFHLDNKALSSILNLPERKIEELERPESLLPDNIKIVLRQKLNVSYTFMLEKTGSVIEEIVPVNKIKGLRKAVYVANNYKINEYHHHESNEH